MNNLTAYQNTGIRHATCALTRNTVTSNTGTSNRRNLTIAAAAIAALSFSSCSALVEKATEQAVEEGVERAIEADSGEDVDLDFDAGDGSFAIETEDGSFSVDGEEGTFVLETDEGTFEGSGDENGFEVTDEDGSTVVDADYDADGTGENGQVEITTDDGSFVSGSGSAAWELWPSELPRPELGGDVTVTGTSADDEGLWLIAGGEVDGTPAEAVEEFTDRLDGFTHTSEGSGGDSVWVNLESDDYIISIVVDGSSSPTVMSMTLTTAS